MDNTTNTAGEALDLNKLEALAKAARDDIIRSHGWAGTVDGFDALRVDEQYLLAASPVAILDLIALARRSLPVDGAGIKNWQERLFEARPEARDCLGHVQHELGAAYKDTEIADLRAALARDGSAAPAGQQDTDCTTCDGSGMVHRADGEYMGECPCAAPVTAAPAAPTVARIMKLADDYADGQHTEGHFGAIRRELQRAVESLAAPAAPAADKIEEIRALLDEAQGFAAVSPQGKENIAAAIALIDRLAAPTAALDESSEYATKLEHALAEIRDLFPIPESGTLHDDWAASCGNPFAVPAYVKGCIAAPLPTKEGAGEVDAVRYRFLREHWVSFSAAPPLSNLHWKGDKLDAKVDVAIAAQPKDTTDTRRDA